MQKLMGRWMRQCPLNKMSMSVLADVWRALSRWNWLPEMSMTVVNELIVAVCPLPLMRTDLRQEVSECATVSSASERGAGGCSSYDLSELGLAALEKAEAGEAAAAGRGIGLWSDFDGVAGARQALQLLKVGPEAFASTEIDRGSRRVERVRWPELRERTCLYTR